MKTLKNLLLIGLGSLAIGSCGENKENSKDLVGERTDSLVNALIDNQIRNVELKKHNLKDSLTYKKFVEFIKENGEKDEDVYIYFYEKNNLVMLHASSKCLTVNIKKNGKRQYFLDNNFNGLDGLDNYKINKEKTKIIEYLPKEEQFSIADEYCARLKEIMSNAESKEIKK